MSTWPYIIFDVHWNDRAHYALNTTFDSIEGKIVDMLRVRCWKKDSDDAIIQLRNCGWIVKEYDFGVICTKINHKIVGDLIMLSIGGSTLVISSKPWIICGNHSRKYPAKYSIIYTVHGVKFNLQSSHTYEVYQIDDYYGGRNIVEAARLNGEWVDFVDFRYNMSRALEIYRDELVTRLWAEYRAEICEIVKKVLPITCMECYDIAVIIAIMMGRMIVRPLICKSSP